MDEMSLKRLDNPNDSWEPCPPGALSQLVRRDGRRRSVSRSLTMAGAAAGGTVCVLLLLGSMGLLELNSASPSGGSQIEPNSGVTGVSLSYSCRDTIDLRDRFLLGNAPPEARAAAREHLSHCPHCQAAYRQRAQELKVEYTVLVRPDSATSDFLVATVARR